MFFMILTCNCCKEWKMDNNFYKDKRNKNSFAHTCKDCQRVRAVLCYHRNKERIQRARKLRAQARTPKEEMEWIEPEKSPEQIAMEKETDKESQEAFQSQMEHEENMKREMEEQWILDNL